MAAEWIEQSVRALTNRYEGLYRWMLEMRAQLRALQQGLQAAQQQGSGGTGSSSAGAFWSSPSAGVAAGASLSAETVFQTMLGVDTALPGTWPIYNRLGAPLVATNKAVVQPDGGGGFMYVSQGCT